MTRAFGPALNLVAAYGAIMGRGGPLPGTLADEALLPCRKQELRLALLVCLKWVDIPADQRAALRGAYLQLADFQPGVGGEDVTSDEARARGLELAAARAERERKCYRQDLRRLGL